MRIPKYWSEARAQRREGGRQVTVRRFGWSDESQQHAQRHADERAAQALEEAWRLPQVPRREPKVPYNGAEGVPIREEIIAEHGSTIITRNSYGALCLNTPDVLFADIDYTRGVNSAIGCSVGLLAAAVAAALCFQLGVAWAAVAAVPVTLVLAFVLLDWLARSWYSLFGGVERVFLGRIERLANQHRDWQLRVYRTPAGLRVLAMHDLFDPTAESTVRLFASLGADPTYTQMCRRQACFRARVSPKPWRVGMDRHLKPRPGVWPIAEERMPDRRAWIVDYEHASSGHAACEYVTTCGMGRTHDKARAVQTLHDEMCQADRGLPIA